jgi:uncharacterized damage-inducible protein DinB
MQLNHIYPYFYDLRSELIDTIADLTDEQWKARFGRRTLYSAEQIVFRLTEQERWWIGHVCQSLPWEDIRPKIKHDKIEALEQFKATIALTDRYIETLEPESLLYVRTVPPDMKANRPEENRRIDWIVWQVIGLEMAAVTQIQLLTQL